MKNLKQYQKHYYYGPDSFGNNYLSYQVLRSGSQVDMIYNNTTGEVDRRMIKKNYLLFFKVAG